MKQRRVDRASHWIETRGTGTERHSNLAFGLLLGRGRCRAAFDEPNDAPVDEVRDGIDVDLVPVRKIAERAQREARGRERAGHLVVIETNALHRDEARTGVVTATLRRAAGANQAARDRFMRK